MRLSENTGISPRTHKALKPIVNASTIKENIMINSHAVMLDHFTTLSMEGDNQGN